MIIPADQDLIVAMIGKIPDGGMPLDFLEEYKIRVRMIASAGTVGGLRTFGMMQLLRDFDMLPEKGPEYEKVKSWRNIPLETPVNFTGRRGTFKGVQGDEGLLLIQIDGQRFSQEVNADQVTIAKSIIEGIDDAVFERDPADTPKNAADFDPPEPKEEDDGPSKADLLFAAWEGVAAGTLVQVQIDGETIEAEYVDVEGEQIAVSINDELRTVDSSAVTLPTEA